LSLSIGYAGSLLTELGKLALLTVPHRVATCHKRTGRVGFEMSLYSVREFLGVLLVVAGLMGTALFVGVALILFWEGIRRALRPAKPCVITLGKGSGENMTTLEFRPAGRPSNVDILWGMKPQEIDSILSAARPRRFSAKSVMTHQGDSSDYFLLMWKGRGRFFYIAPTGKKLILLWIKPGETFGVAGLSRRPYPYIASSEAVQDSVVLAWDRSAIISLGDRFPRLLENVMYLTFEYLSWYIAAHSALVSESAKERLANLLVALGPSIGEVVSDGIAIDVTNQELADSVNINLFNATRIVSDWQKSGAIRKQRGRIVLRSPKKLFLHSLDPKLRASQLLTPGKSAR
jgi:CRP-like cAMP-binding protein